MLIALGKSGVITTDSTTGKPSATFSMAARSTCRVVLSFAARSIAARASPAASPVSPVIVTCFTATSGESRSHSM